MKRVTWSLLFVVSLVWSIMATPAVRTQAKIREQVEKAQKAEQSSAKAKQSEEKPAPLPYPKSFSHIGITVPDIEAAVKFYSEVMGWYLIMPPTKVEEEDKSAIGKMCIDVFGTGWKSFNIAHMSTSDRIGIELFEFKQSKEQKPVFDPFRTGLFHFSVQDPDIEGLVAKIVAHGGKQRMPIREYYPNEKPYRMCYVEDPFGVVFEIYSHSYELHYSSGAYR